MQKPDHFERYTPQHSLPVDITSMSQQDTVCQFCGVSYLIHNEIKALEEKCRKLETDLAYRSGMSSREAALEQTTQNDRTRIFDLESSLAINNHKFNELTRKLQLVQDQLEQSESSHQETKSSLSKVSSHLQLVRNQLQHIRKDYCTIKDTYLNDIQSWKLYLQTVENVLQTEIRATMDKHVKQMNDDQKEIEQYQQRLSIENELETAREEIETQRNELIHLRQELSTCEVAKINFQNELEQMKQRVRELEHQLLEKDQSTTNTNLLLNKYREQLNNEKELRLKNDVELEDIRSKYLQLTVDYETLETMKKDFETKESTTQRKIDEINRSRQAVLDRTRDEYEKLLRKYTELEEMYNELLDIREKDTSESKHTRIELDRLQSDNAELIKQRETLQITHSIQIKKVHDTYTGKLREVEKWPDRLQTELNHEREQHQIQLRELEQRLTDNFLLEMDIEKKKFNSLLRKHEQDSGHSTEKLWHELLSTEKVTIEQRQYYTKQIDQLEREKDNLKQELNTLRDTLKELYKQLNQQESMNDNVPQSLHMREDLLDKEKKLHQAQSTINELQNCLEQTREEMVILQETVRRECTEREQLKEALVDSRQQLLTIKKKSILNGTASRSLHSPPIAFEELEKSVPEPLTYSHSYQRGKIPQVQSEPTAHDNSLLTGTADLMARSLASSKNILYRHNALPPISHQQQSQRQHLQRQRHNGKTVLPNKTEFLVENQRRITRFIKHMK